MRYEWLKNKRMDIIGFSNPPKLDYYKTGLYFNIHDIKSAVNFYKKYLNSPIIYFDKYPNQLEKFLAYLGLKNQYMIKEELPTFVLSFNEWLFEKTFEDVMGDT